MKNTILITCLLGISLVACSSGIPAADIPSIVLNAFKADFPKATDVKWDKVQENYEAEFDMDSVEHEVVFSADGRKIMQKKEITATELPSAVSTTLQNDFKTYAAEDFEQIIKNGVTYYQMELETKGQPDKNLVFAADGRQDAAFTYWD